MMSSARDFQIPEGPSPMPTMDSEDEESFVVLGKSLMPQLDLSFNNLKIESIKKEAVEEGKELIKSLTISQLEMPDLSDDSLVETEKTQSQISLRSIVANSSPAEVQEKINLLVDENMKLRDIIVKNNASMELQHEKIVAWKEEVNNTHQLHKEKFAEAKACITNLVEEKTRLVAELEKNEEIRQLQETELLRTRGLLKQRSSERNVQSSNDTVGKEKDIDGLKKQLDEAVKKREEIENFLKIVYAQKESVNKEKDELELTKNKLTVELQKRDKLIIEMENQLKEKDETFNQKILSLYAENDNLQKQARATVNLKEDLENVRKQLMASQENITRLLQANGILEAQLTAEKEKLKELNNLESIKEEYGVLQQQLDIYKADFEEERRLKENYKAENKQLATDFQQVQKRNGELQDELEILKERGWQFVPTGRRTSSTSNVSAESPPPLTYECPICFLKYRTLKFLEDHVSTCNPEPTWL